MKIFTIANKKEERFLRKKVKTFEFSKFTQKEIRTLVKEMRGTMRVAPGIGLAANQGGLDFSLFVAQVPKSRDSTSEEKFYAIFNPKLIKLSKEKEFKEEGCLSVPGCYGLVERAERVTLEGYNLQGKKIKIKAWGVLAHVLQHEVDHLHGVLFIDKAKEVYRVENPKQLTGDN